MSIVLVTGASGFIGSAIATRFLDLGHEVVGLDAKERPHIPPAGRPGFHFYKADITDPAAFPGDIREAEIAVHCAALVHGASADLSRRNFFAVNCEGTRNIFNALARGRLRHFLFMSSICVYGALPQRSVPDETTPPEPEDAYGESKVAAEQAIGEISGRTGIPSTIFRLTPVYGPGFLTNLRRRVLLPGNLGFYRMTGAARRRISLCSVGNVVDVTIGAMDSTAFFGQTFIVKDAEDYSPDDIIQAFKTDLPLRRRPAVPVPVVLPKLAIRVLSLASPDRGRYWDYKLNKILKDAIFSGEKLRRQGIPMKWTLDSTLRKP